MEWSSGLDPSSSTTLIIDGDFVVTPRLRSGLDINSILARTADPIYVSRCLRIKSKGVIAIRDARSQWCMHAIYARPIRSSDRNAGGSSPEESCPRACQAEGMHHHASEAGPNSISRWPNSVWCGSSPNIWRSASPARHRATAHSPPRRLAITDDSYLATAENYRLAATKTPCRAWL